MVIQNLSMGESHAAEERAAVRCLFCLGGSIEMAFEGVEDYFFNCAPGQFDYLRCVDCGSLVLGNPLAGDELMKAYSVYHTHDAPIDASPAEETRSFKARLKAGYTNWRFAGARDPWSAFAALASYVGSEYPDDLGVRYRYAPAKPSKLLDYGCGNGAFLKQMKELGHSVIGIEIDDRAARTARSLGLDVRSPQAAASGDWDGHFDFISLSHVIEHVDDPTALLSQLRDWLAPGGILYVEAPNAEAAGLQLFGKYWRGLEAPRHLSVPSERGLLTTLTNTGFRPKRKRPGNVGKSVAREVWNASHIVASEKPDSDRLPGREELSALTLTKPEYLYFLARRPD